MQFFFSPAYTILPLIQNISSHFFSFLFFVCDPRTSPLLADVIYSKFHYATSTWLLRSFAHSIYCLYFAECIWECFVFGWFGGHAQAIIRLDSKNYLGANGRRSRKFQLDSTEVDCVNYQRYSLLRARRMPEISSVNITLMSIWTSSYSSRFMNLIFHEWNSLKLERRPIQKWQMRVMPVAERWIISGGESFKLTFNTWYFIRLMKMVDRLANPTSQHIKV